jgi:transposase-like protein
MTPSSIPRHAIAPGAFRRAPQRRYPERIRASVLALAIRTSPAVAAHCYGINAGTVRTWVRRARRQGTYPKAQSTP